MFTEEHCEDGDLAVSVEIHNNLKYRWTSDGSITDFAVIRKNLYFKKTVLCVSES